MVNNKTGKAKAKRVGNNTYMYLTGENNERLTRKGRLDIQPGGGGGVDEREMRGDLLGLFGPRPLMADLGSS